jgi:DNA-directed RNA polymerase subunit H (RpoH/RPB5)
MLHVPSHAQVADEEANKMIFDMLNALATFQERAKEKDPLKAKAKARFGMGMKQVGDAWQVV